MQATQSWLPATPDLTTVRNTHPDPLRALAHAEMPAIVLRQAYNSADCPKLLQRFLDWGLMRDPKAATADQRNRIDIGTSLGNRGHDQERFLTHAVATHELFRVLFDGFDDPVKTIYDALQQLAGDKTVKTAQEPDGRQYGPAIFRIHYDSHAYKPHIDHVTLREKRFRYAVSRFEHQFAGILCLQNAAQPGHLAIFIFSTRGASMRFRQLKVRIPVPCSPSSSAIQRMTTKSTSGPDTLPVDQSTDSPPPPNLPRKSGRHLISPPRLRGGARGWGECHD